MLRLQLRLGLWRAQPAHLLSRGLSCRFYTTKEKPKNLGSDIKRLLRLAKPEYRYFGGALLCLFCTSAVLMLLPFFIGKIIDTTKEENEGNQILGVPPSYFYGGIACVFSAGAIANFGRIYLLRLVGEKLVARLRSRLFAKILSQDSYFFDVGPTKKGMKTGDLISRLSSDTQIISKFVSGNVSDGARAVISGCVGLSMMCYLLWKMTLCMSLMFPPLILMSTVYGRRIKRLSRQIQEALGDMSKVSEEKFNGLKTIQSFAQQQPVVHEFNRDVRSIFLRLLHEGRLSGLYYSVNGLLGNITIIGLLVIGTRLIAQGELLLGDLLSFMMYAIYTGSSVFGLGNFYTELMKGLGALERVFELMGLRPRIATGKGVKVPVEGRVEFSNVSFSYPSRPDVQVFSGLLVAIEPGEHVCFVGHSGSGKSTIAQLLLRFYDPNSGDVLVDGRKVQDLNLNHYRLLVGYVQQEPLLFSGTIRENITFGHPATDAEIEEAARLSNAHDFISEFPKGYDTVIGPTSSGSAQLSGGQRQRISLARTLIKKPRLLVLDEATLALDLRLEELVMRNLALLADNVTIISIAHRLLTIKNSERVIVVGRGGEIKEDGSFTELYGDKTLVLNRLLSDHDSLSI